MITPHGPVTNSEVPNGSVTAEKLAAGAVTTGKLDIEELDVTVTEGGTTGTAICTAGATIIGCYPASNQDQFVGSVAIADTTLTVTLTASATADNMFKVVCVKPIAEVQ